MGYLLCVKCGKRFAEEEKIWKCKCGGLLSYKNLRQFQVTKVDKNVFSLWRYAHTLPVEFSSRVSLGEGLTPLEEVKVAGRTVFFKLDYIFPSGSYKDRGATVLVSKLRELGITEVVEDSSGNAGAAIAAYCAKAGIRSKILVPEANSAGKLQQISAVGAELVAVSGSRQAVADKALLLAEKLYYASHSYNPFFLEGTKTFAYEVAEQLGWQAPDTIVLPVGNGTLLLGAYLGFKHLHDSGVICNIPKIVAVQAKACAPLARTFTESKWDKLASVQSEDTLAEGIAIQEPVRWLEILQAVADTKGEFIQVEEEQITKALEKVKKMGIYIEPTAVAAYAGVESYLSGKQNSQEVIISAFTGHGLKKS